MPGSPQIALVVNYPGGDEVNIVFSYRADVTLALEVKYSFVTKRFA
jgi:hypothetical protein